MVSLLKTFGKGILYVLGLPFFIVALVLFAVFGIFAFIWQAIKSIFFFFSGQKFFPELPEDKELRLLKESGNQQVYQEAPIQQENNQEQDIILPFEEEQKVEEEPAPIVEEKPAYNSVEEACFVDDSIKQEEEPQVEETLIDDTLNDVLNPIPEFKQDEDEVIEEKEEEPQTVVETAEPKMDEDELVEELETYVPRSSNYSAADDDEEDTDTGVNIDFDFRG